jgi:hypothetical protein
MDLNLSPLFYPPGNGSPGPSDPPWWYQIGVVFSSQCSITAILLELKVVGTYILILH